MSEVADRSGTTTTPPTLEVEQDQENYHSVPASGNAQGVGLTKVTADEENGNMQPFEQEPEDDILPYIDPPTGEVLEGWFMNIGSMFAIRQVTAVQACYLGVAAILGTLLRIVLAQLFGEACKNPDTVGWLAASAPLCVTASGETDQIGGIIFADLPSNILGSFIMGLMQTGESLGLATTAPVAWLDPTNVFQGYTILHLAIKTGFCGSLTTFSSWNSEMVVMLAGTGATHLENQFWKAVFGYIIGLETAIGSYVFGRTVAVWLHKWRNPSLGQESVAIRARQEQGYVVNTKLPPLERRFLFDLPLFLEGEYPPTPETTPGLESLEKWRESTREARRLEHSSCTTLQEVETALLADRRPFLPEMEAICHQEGWNVDALKDYLRAQGPAIEAQMMEASHLSAAGVYMLNESSRMFQWPYALAVLAVTLAILVYLLATIEIDDAYGITYRTMVFGMLFATPGALLRWRLSTYNGNFPYNSSLQWIPTGTLAANWFGSIVSIAMIATEYRLTENYPYGFWAMATLRAVKIGFCGCLTTVSTFIAEVHDMMRKHHFDRAYQYVTLSLLGAAVLGVIVFCGIVYTAPEY